MATQFKNDPLFLADFVPGKIRTQQGNLLVPVYFENEPVLPKVPVAVEQVKTKPSLPHPRPERSRQRRSALLGCR